MAGKKTLVIFGATGNQGGSVVKSILGDPKAKDQFHLKGVTRNVNSDKAKAMAAKGVEPVTADNDDKESLKAAIKGAYGVFAVTNYWEKMDEKLEEKQGKTVADVCKEEGVQHLVWSSLINVKKLTNGVLSNVDHFDSKARVEEYIREIGIPATFFMPGFFMSNITSGGLRKGEDGKYSWALPIPDSSPMPLFDAGGDTGKWVKAIFMKRDQVLGKQVQAATDYYTPKQIIETFQETFPEAGKGASFNQLPQDVYKGILEKVGLPPHAALELTENMRLMPEFGYYGGASLDFSHSILDEKPTTWKDFLKSAPAFKDMK